MIVLSECFPLLIGVAPVRYTAASVRELTESFEIYFRRGQQYAFISVQPPGSIPPGPSERKLLMQWLASERVRQYSGQLCVSAAAVVDNTVMRGALTALLWFWKPPFALEVVGTATRAIAHCVRGLERSRVPLPASADVLRSQAERALAAALATPRSATR